MSPLEVVQHEPGAKANRTPFFEVDIDALSLFGEFLAGAIELAVVVKVVDADFKAIGG